MNGIERERPQKGKEQATRLDLATGLFTQPLEQDDLRDLLTDPTGRTSAQTILRIGHATITAP